VACTDFQESSVPAGGDRRHPRDFLQLPDKDSSRGVQTDLLTSCDMMVLKEDVGLEPEERGSYHHISQAFPPRFRVPDLTMHFGWRANLKTVSVAVGEG
jgi:hypothetical protein